MAKGGEERSLSQVGASPAAVSPADYAPSPNTCSQALVKANQLRVQALLRQLLSPATELGPRLNALRVLRRTMRELDHQLSWLTQVDFFETMERILRNETLDLDSDWRLIHDTTQLLIETLPRASFEPDAQTVGQIFASAVQNLGHLRSEVRRVSLLLINMQLNEKRANNFKYLLKLFIDYGLANERNKQAQRGAILSLPLLMTEQVVEGEDLLPLIKSLSELLVEAEPQLFYSLYLALQRLNMTLGDKRFLAYLRQCSPDAVILYRQAASRSGSMEQPSTPKRRSFRDSESQLASEPSSEQVSDTRPHHHQQQMASDSKQVTFEADQPYQMEGSELQRRTESVASSVSLKGRPASSLGEQANDQELASNNDEQLDQMTPAYCAPGLSDSSCPSETSSLVASEIRRPRATTTGHRTQDPLDRSSVSSTCSSEANLVDPIHYMNAAALSGNPMANYEQVHHIDHSNTGLAINDLCVSCSPTMELGPAAQQELKFGIFPRHLVIAALGNRYLDRLEALQEMMCIIRDSPINHLAILMTYFDSFLSQFLARLVESGTDYKVELIAIDMIETIVIKTKVSAMQYIRPMVGLLVKSLGDPRTIFRDNSVRVIHKMMAFLPPQHVIDAIFEHKHSKSPLVREESVNRVTAAVLEYDRNEFNLTKLCYHVLPMLADHQASVRLAALECIATLAHALGPERIGSLLTAAEAVQTGCDYDGFLDAIHARIMRRSLPRCNADGSIRYVIKPFLNASGTTYHQEHQAADVRWVLEAPSTHQHLHHGQHQHHEPELHHAHRPGVYSPVPAGGPRRCSVPVALVNEQSLDHQHHHHHHHPHHSQHQQQQQQQDTKGGSRDHSDRPSESQVATDGDPVTQASSSGPPLAASSTQAKAYNGDPIDPVASNSNKQQMHESKGAASSAQRRASCKGHGDIAQKPQTSGNISEIGKRHQNRLSGGSQETRDDGVSSNARRPSKATRGKRSSSQDSSSSTDTNKVLFQYYLGKFKQSLEDTGTNGNMQSVLPSDSIIHTDIVQAYELSRHQSRYQQTSFDYDIGPVGRVPVGIDQSSGSHQLSSVVSHDARSDSLSLKGQRGTSSPQSSSSESPQTVMEQLDARRRSQPQTRRKTSNGADTASSGEQQVADRRQRHASSRDAAGQEDLSHQQNDAGQQSSSRRSSAAQREPSRQMSEQESGQVGGRKPSGGQQRHKSNEETQPEGSYDGSRRPVEGGPCDTGDSSLASKRVSSERVRTRGSRGETPKNSQEEIGAESKLKTESQQFRARGLVRQSASAVIAGEEPPAIDEAGMRSSPEDGGHNERPVRRDELPPTTADSQLDEINARPTPPMASRQESTGTTDSQHSSQRECSDHATQTTPQHGDSRRSRRRRSHRRSSVSSRGEAREEPARGASPDETGRGEGGEMGAADDDGDRRAAIKVRDQQQQQLQEESEIRRRASRSQPPARQLSRASSRSHLHQQQMGTAQDVRRSVSVSPSTATNVNIRHILENVAESEGPFHEPQLAFRVAMEALSGPCWSTKVEGILALIRLAAHHQQILLARLHEVICRVSNETRNLRSTVARSAIFALGDFCAKLERSIEPEMETIVQAFLQKSIENTAFIRDDIRRALTSMVEHLTQWRLANALISHGASHKNMHVRRMASQFVALLVERMGPAKCLVGARDISAKLIPAAAKFAQDSSPHTRYYGRLILARIMHHSAFERLLRKTLTPNLYRSTVGIVESVKRRGTGDPPIDA